MTKKMVGIVDYGVGNHASLINTISSIGHRCRLSDDESVLNNCDLLILPGVGAFRPAIEALIGKKLDTVLVDYAQKSGPILGICLGMQLLTNVSYEGGYNKGLGLVPGEISPISTPQWHIGWNEIESIKGNPLFKSCKDEFYYFNHSHYYKGPEKFKICKVISKKEMPAAIGHKKVIGVQFHPEKSQLAGQKLLKKLIESLCND